jgi:hypothetical protein
VDPHVTLCYFTPPTPPIPLHPHPQPVPPTRRLLCSDAPVAVQAAEAAEARRSSSRRAARR